MVKRRKTRTVTVGSVKLGSAVPVVIQSMTKVSTTDVEACVEQVDRLVLAGCGLVRIAVPTKADTAAFAKVVDQASVPLIADVHFSPARAIEAIEGGAAKIRLNPGNIKRRSDILRIIDAAKANGVAVRAGINEASIRDLREENVLPEKRTGLMLEKMREYVSIFAGRGFEQLVLSAKSSNCFRTIEVNRLIAEEFDYPLHIGLTHAGLPEEARIASAVCLGTLLAEGIGDTIRVSVAGDPVEEVQIAREILVSLGLCEKKGPELIVCPTCGRAQMDVIKLARLVKEKISSVRRPLRVAVMGCVVNGPGEAADADVALCAGKKKAYIYSRGKRVRIVPAKKAVAALVEEIVRFESGKSRQAK